MNNPSLDYLPPFNKEAEQSVLGACIHSPEAFYKAREILNPDDFYKSNHKNIFRCMDKWFPDNPNSRCDVLTLEEAIKSDKTLGKVGGIEYLSILEDFVPTATAVTYHSKIVKDKSIKRSVLKMADSITQAAYKKDVDSKELLAIVNSEFLKLDDPGTGEIKSYNDLIKDSLRRTESETRAGLLCGFEKLDDITGGMAPGDLIILAARPKMGKTSFAFDIAENIAWGGNSVGILSIEMTSESIGDRRLSRGARINTIKMRNKQFYGDDSKNLHNAAKELIELPIYVDDCHSVDLSGVRSKAIRMKSEWDIKILMIDYLGQINSSGRWGGNRHEEVAAIAKGIKSLAKELKIPIILLSQLNRKCEDRDDKRPQLHDLRESGDIEQEADMVWAIYREAVYNKNIDSEKERDSEIGVIKNRFGPEGIAFLEFTKEYSSFNQPPYKY